MGFEILRDSAFCRIKLLSPFSFMCSEILPDSAYNYKKEWRALLRAVFLHTTSWIKYKIPPYYRQIHFSKKSLISSQVFFIFLSLPLKRSIQ